jgi:hypothetical protein
VAKERSREGEGGVRGACDQILVEEVINEFIHVGDAEAAPIRHMSASDECVWEVHIKSACWGEGER